jgi:hypothetical protein
MLGASDRSVHQAVLAEDFVVVTENHDDYLSLARGEEVHPGLILLASPGGPLQLAAFHAAVDHIEREAAAAAEAPEVRLINRWVASIGLSPCTHGWTFEDPPTP